MANIEVRQATIGDLAEAAALFNEYRQFYGQPSDPDGAQAFLYERFVHLESVIFLAKAGTERETVGFMQLYPTFSSISMQRSWILNDLFVAASARGQGAAQALLDAAAAYARQTGAKGLALSTAPDNVIAQRLYEKNGFERDAEFYHYFLRV
ncbi:GNAT family N-acetyltransferase [Paenibacillus sp.]|uniref:GNAT family N-acetyltransferase n=1 Tax=Paenibacillus sp. TaxID=58172 RepID=UPI002D407B83|nr:GNAT family N-acetyltransferase [Paenibacillus sp.]HZG86741.1 GNAT family N-acetyltransferase [Paenibacillus sp.]